LRIILSYDAGRFVTRLLIAERSHTMTDNLRSARRAAWWWRSASASRRTSPPAVCPGCPVADQQAMMDAMGVSRTVIREAVATLRA
jgi:hypothetical protein